MARSKHETLMSELKKGIIVVGILYFLFKARPAAASTAQTAQESTTSNDVIPQEAQYVQVSNIGDAPAIDVEVSNAGRLNMVQVGGFLVPADTYALFSRRMATGGFFRGDTNITDWGTWEAATNRFGASDGVIKI